MGMELHVVFEPDEAGWVRATVEELPGVITCAPTLDEARELVRDALDEWLKSLTCGRAGHHRSRSDPRDAHAERCLTPASSTGKETTTPFTSGVALGLVTSAGLVELRHLVFASFAPWVTAQDAKHAEPATLEKPVLLDCLAGVLRAAGFVPAIALREVPPKRAMVERKSVLIETDDPEGEGLRQVVALTSAGPSRGGSGGLAPTRPAATEGLGCPDESQRKYEEKRQSGAEGTRQGHERRTRDHEGRNRA